MFVRLSGWRRWRLEPLSLCAAWSACHGGAALGTGRGGGGLVARRVHWQPQKREPVGEGSWCVSPLAPPAGHRLSLRRRRVSALPVL